MSQRIAFIIPVLGTSFAALASSAMGGNAPSNAWPPSPEIVLGRSASTVAQIVAFGGNSYRIKLAVESFQICSAGFHELMSMPRLEGGRSEVAFGGVKPMSLPTTIVVRKPTPNSEIAVLQRTYRKLVSLGLDEEAAEIAALITSPEPPAPVEEGVVHALAVERSEDGRIQPAVFSSPSATSWKTASKSPVSCRFEAVSLETAAKYFQSATGSNVRVRPDGGPFPMVHFSCQNLAAGKAIERMVESCGWTIEVSDLGVELVRPTAVPLRGDRLPILR